jgi:hypothetical protein
MDQVTNMIGSNDKAGRSSRPAPYRTSAHAGDVAQMARDNILPLAMVGLGIGWLVWSNTSHPQVDRRMGDAGRWARDRVGMGGRQNVDMHRSGPGYGSSHDLGGTANLPDRYRNDLGMAYGSEDYRAPSEYHYHEAGRGDRDWDQGQDRGRGYGERARGAVGRIRESVSDYAEHASDAVSDYAHRARDAVGGYAGRARGALHRDRGADRNYAQGGAASSAGIWSTVEQHPMMSGVIGFAVGAAIGAVMPSSRYEDQWLGNYRDRLLDQGTAYGSQAVNRATEVARHAAEAGYEAARETIREEGSEGRDRGQEASGQQGPDRDRAGPVAGSDRSESGQRGA